MRDIVLKYTPEEWEDIVEDTNNKIAELSFNPQPLEDYTYEFMTGMYMMVVLLDEIREELEYA